MIEEIKNKIGLGLRKNQKEKKFEREKREEEEVKKRLRNLGYLE